jgi:drug/metabolite transporter (DMT)-like permease
VKSTLAALAAVILWSSLAGLATMLPGVPVLLKTAIGLLIGSLFALPLSRFNFKKLSVKPSVLLLGVYGLFGFHAALFLALQSAPSVQANLINYLWPLFLVLLAPLFLKSAKVTPRLVMGSLIGFLGAAMAILSGSTEQFNFSIGYLFALIAALIWATYSLGTKRVGSFPTAAVGVFALVAGLLALVLHLLMEPRIVISLEEWIVLVAIGAGPLGAAFYFWDYAIKNGDPQKIGLLAFLTPLLSTTFLLIVSGGQLTYLLVLSAALIVGGAVIGRVKDGV